MRENERPGPIRYIMGIVCLIVMIVIALSPLQGLLWDGVVLLLLGLSLIVIGISTARSLTIVALVLIVGFILLPMLLNQ